MDPFWLRAHNFPTKPVYIKPKPPRHWTLAGLCVFAAAMMVIGYLLGLYHKERLAQARVDEIREMIIEPPLWGRPPQRVIPELGIKLYWLDWGNGPVHKLMVEDVRTY